MADILKITTPLVERLPTAQNARNLEGTGVPFTLSDITKVVQTNDSSEILQQNTGFKPQDAETPKILADLLKDPAVTISMIRNINVLQEVLSLLPANNKVFTQEMEELFSRLLLKPEQIVSELLKQEENTTIFKGTLFDVLRGIVEQNGGKANVATAAGVLLKGLYAVVAKQDALQSVANNLSYLANALDASPRLNEKLSTLAEAFRAPNAQDNFAQLKKEVADAMKDVQSSILFTKRMEQTLPLIMYNLSRYNDNENFVSDALKFLFDAMSGSVSKQPANAAPLVNVPTAPNEQVETAATAQQNAATNATTQAVQTNASGQAAQPSAGEQAAPANADGQTVQANANGRTVQADVKEQAVPANTGQLPQLNQRETEIVRLIQDYVNKYAQDGAEAARTEKEDSQVIDALAKIIGKQAKSEDVKLLSAETVENIVHSLLASPSNFTPLLHFVLPVEFMNMHAFAEIWVDPDPEEKVKNGGNEDSSHMLMVFDVEGIGQFESELYVMGKRIAMNLLCPPEYTEAFAEIGPAIRKAVARTGYTFEAINVGELEHIHSLMEVFPGLPQRRMGVDVKI